MLNPIGRVAAICAGVLAVASHAIAGTGFTSLNTALGANTVTVDDYNGIHWLNVSIPAGQSNEYVPAQLRPSRIYAGYRYATAADVQQLLADFGIVDYTDTQQADDYAGVSALESYLGYSDVYDDKTELYGETADEFVPGTQATYYVALANANQTAAALNDYSLPNTATTVNTVPISSFLVAAKSAEADCAGAVNTGPGSWSCGAGVGRSSFTPMTIRTKNTAGTKGFKLWESAGFYLPAVGRYSGAPVDLATLVLIPGVIMMSRGPTTDAIIQRTAVKEGTFSFTGYYEILNAYPSCIQPRIVGGGTNITGTAFGGGYLQGPGANKQTFTPGGRENLSFKLTVTQGVVESFGVNNAGNYYNDTSGVKVIANSAAP